jgi:hypothetical protein
MGWMREASPTLTKGMGRRSTRLTASYESDS